jgi:hypothetical protein
MQPVFRVLFPSLSWVAPPRKDALRQNRVTGVGDAAIRQKVPRVLAPRKGAGMRRKEGGRTSHQTE